MTPIDRASQPIPAGSMTSESSPGSAHPATARSAASAPGTLCTATDRPARHARFTDELLGWLNWKLAPPGVTIEAETPLFAGGLINSIRILELIAWTERATGTTIPDAMIRMDNFQTARRIGEVFAAEVPDVVV